MIQLPGLVRTRYSKQVLSVITKNNRRENFYSVSLIALWCVFWLPELAVAQSESCEGNTAFANIIEDKYPQPLLFDVYRNGKLVGEHLTRFDNDGGKLKISSKMTLTIKVLFVTVYRFQYQSVDLWCNDRLQWLNAETNRNGKITTVTAMVDSTAIKVKIGDREQLADVDIIPTNHWNANVLEANQVLNTLTGNINNVAIRRCVTGNPEIESAAPGAECFAYSGELETRVWYDGEGRWRGLEFAGDDGSSISYVCRQCE